MAGRPKTRAKREAEERARRQAGAPPVVNEAIANAIGQNQCADGKKEDAQPGHVKLPPLEYLASDICTLAQIKLANKPVTNTGELNEFEQQIVACQKVIALLLEDTSQKISAVETLNALQITERVTSYFEECDKTYRSYTVPGLAYAIGFINRKQLVKFVEENIETLPGYVIARALMRIEEQRNIEILAGNGMMTGHKLDLATNFEWNDAKQKSSKEEEKPTQITQNIINYNSLPPTQMSVEEWQAKFLQQQKTKDQEVIELPPGDQDKK